MDRKVFISVNMIMRKANRTIKLVKRSLCALLVFIGYFGVLDIARQSVSNYASVQIPSPYIKTTPNGFSFQYSVLDHQVRTMDFTFDAVKSFLITTIQQDSSFEWLRDWSIHFQAFPYSAQKPLEGVLSIQVFQNSDSFIHYQFKNSNPSGYPIQMSVSCKDNHALPGNTILYYPFAYDQQGKIQIQKTTNPVCTNQMRYIQVNRYQQIKTSYLFGPYFHYKELPDGLLERDEAYSTSESYWKENTFFTRQIFRVEGNKTGEAWFIVSHQPIVQIESAVTRQYLSTLDFNLRKVFTNKGFFYKTNQEGFLGENDQTYYWDYSMYGVKSLLDFYYNGSETLPYNLSLISLHALLKNQNSQGYWSNQTISVWLKNQYGLGSRYYDTRFNVDAGLFTLQLYEKFAIPEALVLAKKQGNLLMSFIQKGYTIPTTSYGYLLRDYICLDQPTMHTHASLNHLLNASLFLRQLSRVTGVGYYENAAKRIENGIKATEKLWYNKRTKDLYYCIDSRFQSSRTDYPLLTYHDLLRLIRYHERYTKEDVSVYVRLATFKENWLIRNNLIKVRKVTKAESNE